MFPLSILIVAVLACGTEAPPPAFDGQRAWRHMEKLCQWGPRTPGSAARDSAAAYIVRTMESYGAKVSAQVFEMDDPYGEGTLRLVNVIASFEPERKRRLMLCAHYDSRPWADQELDSTLWDQPILGAVDGGAGSGVIMEVGRLLSQHSPREIGVDIVFFDGEDYGKPSDLKYYLLGAKHFVVNLDGYRPVSAVLLDMVGGEGTQIGREGNSVRGAKALVDTLFNRAAAMGLDYFVGVDGPPIYDDHVPLLLAGIPAVDLFGYDYTHWHTLADTPDKCEPNKLEQVGRLLASFVYDFPF